MAYPAIHVKEDRTASHTQEVKEELEDARSRRGDVRNLADKLIGETTSPSPVLLLQAPDSHIPFGPFTVRHPPRRTLSPARGDNEATAPQTCTETCSSSSSMLPSERSQEGPDHESECYCREICSSPSPVDKKPGSTTSSSFAAFSLPACSTSSVLSPLPIKGSVDVSTRRSEDFWGQRKDRPSKVPLSVSLLPKALSSSPGEKGKTSPSLCPASPSPPAMPSTCSTASSALSCPPSLECKEVSMPEQGNVRTAARQPPAPSPPLSMATTPLVSWPSSCSVSSNSPASAPCVGCSSFGLPVAASTPAAPSSPPPSNWSSSAQSTTRFLVFPAEMSHPHPMAVTSPLRFPDVSSAGRCPSFGSYDPLPSSPGDSAPSNSSVCTTPSYNSQPSLNSCSLPVPLSDSPASDQPSSVHLDNRPSLSMVMHPHLLSKITPKPSGFTSPARILPPADPALFLPLSASSRISSPASTDSVLSAGPPGLLAAYSAELLCEPQIAYQIEPRRVRFIEGREEWLLSEAASVNSLIALSDDGGGTSIAFAVPTTGAPTCSPPPANPPAAAAYEYSVDPSCLLPAQSQMVKETGNPNQKPHEYRVSPKRDVWSQGQAQSSESPGEAPVPTTASTTARSAPRHQDKEGRSDARQSLLSSAAHSTRRVPFSPLVVLPEEKKSISDEAHATVERAKALPASSELDTAWLQSCPKNGQEPGHEDKPEVLWANDSLGEGVKKASENGSSAPVSVSRDFVRGCPDANIHSTGLSLKTCEQGLLSKGFFLVSCNPAAHSHREPHSQQTTSPTVAATPTMSPSSSPVPKAGAKTMYSPESQVLMPGGSSSGYSGLSEPEARDVSYLAKTERSDAWKETAPSAESLQERETLGVKTTSDRDPQETGAEKPTVAAAVPVQTNGRSNVTDAQDACVPQSCFFASAVESQTGWMSFMKDPERDIAEPREGGESCFSFTAVIQRQMTSPAEAISVRKSDMLSSPPSAPGTASPSSPGRRRHQTAPPLSGATTTRQGRLVTVRGRDGVLRRQSLHVPPCLSTTTPGKSCVRRPHEQPASRSSTPFSSCHFSSPSFSASLSSLLKRSLRRRRNRSRESGSRSDSQRVSGGKNRSREASQHGKTDYNSPSPSTSSSSSASTATVFCSPHHLTRSLFPYFVVRTSAKHKRQDGKGDRGLAEKQSYFPDDDDDVSPGVCKDRFPTEQIFELPVKPEAYQKQTASSDRGQAGRPQVGDMRGLFFAGDHRQQERPPHQELTDHPEKSNTDACGRGLTGSASTIEETHGSQNPPAEVNESLAFCSDEGTKSPRATKIVASAHPMLSPSTPFLGPQHTRESRFSSFSSLPVNFGWRQPTSRRSGRTQRSGSLPLLPRKGSQAPLSSTVVGGVAGHSCRGGFEGFQRYAFDRESHKERSPSPGSLLGEDDQDEDEEEEDAASYPLQFLDIATPQANE